MGINLSTLPFLGHESYLSELKHLKYEKSLGNSRFIKTIKCRDTKNDTVWVAKVFMKPEGFSAKELIDLLSDQYDKIQHSKNILFPFNISETEKGVYLERQFIAENLYDRISTRPFPTAAEKKWIVYQLLRTLRDLHNYNIVHGDIKAENILVTTWNWIYLSDFASFKPVTIPPDDPSDFAFFFDSSGRHNCYLAPERICADDGLYLTEKMDIFATGCVIAELFMDGKSVFDLPKLLKYKESDTTVLKNVNADISDTFIAQLVQKMLIIDPEKRPSAIECLEQFESYLLPSLQLPFLYNHFCQDFDWYRGNFDGIIERLYIDFDTLLSALCSKIDGNCLLKSELLSTVNIPNYSNVVYPPNDILLVLIDVLNNASRLAKMPTSILMYLDMALVLSFHLDSINRLNRIVPFIVALLSVENIAVKITALKHLTAILSSITEVTSAETELYPEYIIPAIMPFFQDECLLVRRAIAESIGTLLSACQDHVCMLLAIQSVENGKKNSFDSLMKDLRNILEAPILTLITDPSNEVRMELLKNLSLVAVFIGRQKANDVLLSHIIAYLNDSDWRLRQCFYQYLVPFCVYLGPLCVEQYILPLTIQSLNDSEETVIEQVIHCLALFVDYNLLTKMKIVEVFVRLFPYLLHPNCWIRKAVISFLVKVSNIFEYVDMLIHIMPKLKMILSVKIHEISEIILTAQLQKPISRAIFSRLLIIAAEDPFYFKLIADAQTVKEIQNVSDAKRIQFSQELVKFDISNNDLQKINILEKVLQNLSKNRRRLSFKDDNSSVDYESGMVILKNLRVLPRSLPINMPVDPDTVIGDTSQTSLFRLLRMASNEGLAITESQPRVKDLRRLLESKMMNFNSMSWSQSNQTSSSVYEKITIDTKRALPMLLSWRPEGNLIFEEEMPGRSEFIYTSVGPSHDVFLTYSKGGSVIYIWETKHAAEERVLQIISHYDCHEGISCATFLDVNSRIAVGTCDGMLLFIRLAPSSNQQHEIYDSIKYEDKNVTLMYTQQLTSTMFLIYVTDDNFIYLYDLSTNNMMENSLQEPLSHGMLSCVLLGNSGNWLLIGTEAGYISLWDVRFKLCVKSVIYPLGTPITGLCLHPNRNENELVICLSSSQISIWDIQQMLPVEVLGLEQDKSKIISAFTSTVQNGKHITSPSNSNDYSRIVCYSVCNNGTFVITGSADGVLRYWDLDIPINSFIISGLPASASPPIYKQYNVASVTKVYLEEMTQVEENQEKSSRFDVFCSVQILLSPNIGLLSVEMNGSLKLWA